MKTVFPALLKREFWENRGSLLLAPFITGLVLVLLQFMSLVGTRLTAGKAQVQFGVAFDIGDITRSIGPQDLQVIGTMLDVGMLVLAALLQLVLYIVVVFYVLGSLFDERKDRSLLFWRSMPVSDLQSVLAKLVTATLVAPVLVFLATVMTQLLFLIVLSLFVMLYGGNAFQLIWGPVNLLEGWAKLLALVPLLSLWALPGIGWLMLVSAWTRSKPFLWAVMVPLLASIAISTFQLTILLRLPEGWTWHAMIGRLLGWIFSVPIGLFQSFDGGSRTPIKVGLTWEQLGGVLSHSGTWIGVAVGVAFIAAAVYLRRYRDEA